MNSQNPEAVDKDLLWLSTIDLKSFSEEITEIGDQAERTLSHDDYLHLRKIELWGRLSTVFGYATAWLAVNPISAFLISLGIFTRWLLAHHILHRGYDKVPGVPHRYTSKGFAQGLRRYVDWFDWLRPDAWDYEHNILHHYHTGEEHDPDLVERHLKYLRELRLPYILKYALILLVSFTWKYTYYSPNTLSVIDPKERQRIRKENLVYLTILNVFDFRRKAVRDLWITCYLPYGLTQFVLLPLLFFPLGSDAVFNVFLTRILAECFTNFHSFLIIGPNHTADDLYSFDFHYENREQYYVTQILSSANYHCGNDLIDYLSIWLNYQIEHHLYPQLPMSKYQEVQPKVKAVCEKYGIPYRQESVFIRFRKMLDVCVGKTSLRPLSKFPDTPVLQTAS